MSVVKRVAFISDRTLYIVLRGCWCDIIVLTVHAPIEDKSDDSKDSFYEELEQVFDHFPQYHIKIMLGDFNAKLGGADIFKPKIGNESLREGSNDNGVRVVNFASSPHCCTVNSNVSAWCYALLESQSSHLLS
jgi:hypothetical protein